MIRKCDKPDVFKHLCDDHYFIEGYDNSVYANLAIDFRMPECAVLHLEVSDFSHTTLKKLVLDWQDVKKVLIKNSVKSVAVTKNGLIENHKKFAKFIKFFGFNEMIQHITSIQEI